MMKKSVYVQYGHNFKNIFKTQFNEFMDTKPMDMECWLQL